MKLFLLKNAKFLNAGGSAPRPQKQPPNCGFLATRLAEEVVRRSARIARSPELPAFVDSRDYLDIYLLRFERYATVAGWEKEAWATQLSPLLLGSALKVYSRLSQYEAMDYERLKLALLKRYDFTEFGYRRRFRDAKPEGQESPGQFIARLKNYLTKWVKLAKVKESFDGVVELIVQEQFTNACPKELSVYLNERSPKTLDELATWADQYLMAHDKTLSSKNAIGRRENLNVDESERSPERTREFLNCYRYGGEGHCAVECMSKIPDGRCRSGDRRISCYRCGGLGHEVRDCRSRLPSQPAPRSGPSGANPPVQVYQVGCAIQLPEAPPQEPTGNGQVFELKSRGSIKVIHATACEIPNSKDKLPLVTRKVGGKSTEVLRGTGCTGVIVKRN